MADTIAEKIEEVALAGVQRVSVDGTSVESISIKDLIDASKHVAHQQAASQTHFGLRFAKLVTRAD
jgi:hypothetical protein